MKASSFFYATLTASTAWAQNTEPSDVFLVKYKGEMIPLSGFYRSTNKSMPAVLAFQTFQNSNPVEFTFDGTFATTEAQGFQGNAGFHNGLLTVSGSTPKTPFELDDKKKIINSKFQSCEMTSNALRVVINTPYSVGLEDCQDVDVYIKTNPDKIDYTKYPGYPGNLRENKEGSKCVRSSD